MTPSTIVLRLSYLLVSFRTPVKYQNIDSKFCLRIDLLHRVYTRIDVVLYHPCLVLKIMHRLRWLWRSDTRSSSGDEIAHVNCFTTTSYTYYKVQTRA